MFFLKRQFYRLLESGTPDRVPIVIATTAAIVNYINYEYTVPVILVSWKLVAIIVSVFIAIIWLFARRKLVPEIDLSRYSQDGVEKCVSEHGEDNIIYVSEPYLDEDDTAEIELEFSMPEYREEICLGFDIDTETYIISVQDRDPLNFDTDRVITYPGRLPSFSMKLKLTHTRLDNMGPISEMPLTIENKLSGRTVAEFLVRCNGNDSTN
ncbi:hypothetical protein [Halorubrum sp. SP9]|uniref:hypothetical protein n=1 Tax=Halorubrum sp. SP9 TaxID=1537267 RepID=UPI0010F9BECA|nr:hypothetical protein [Halorubrum sp. SP9]TKX68837.1 hypothetical protein EXE45_10270 [Halorubrum sp. SP9]